MCLNSLWLIVKGSSSLIQRGSLDFSVGSSAFSADGLMVKAIAWQCVTSTSTRALREAQLAPGLTNDPNDPPSPPGSSRYPLKWGPLPRFSGEPQKHMTYWIPVCKLPRVGRNMMQHAQHVESQFPAPTPKSWVQGLEKHLWWCGCGAAGAKVLVRAQAGSSGVLSKTWQVNHE